MNKEEKLQEELVFQTEKWRKRIKEEIKKVKTAKDQEFLDNIHAYIKDSKHFSGKKDYVRAFEAIVWAWAWLEIGRRKNIL